MALEITIVFSAVLILGANSAPSELKASSVTKPEENEDKSPTGIQLQCYTGTYSSEIIFKNGLQNLSNSQVCPEGSACFIRKIGRNFTFGCAEKNPEIGAGNCRNFTSQIVTNNVEISRVTITECHCHTNKCLVPSIFAKHFSPNSGLVMTSDIKKRKPKWPKRCRKLACGLLELDGIIGVIFLATFLCVGLFLVPIYSRPETS